MEDPVRFDLYGLPILDAIDEARAVVTELFPDLPRKALLQSFHRARVDGAPINIGSSLGWKKAEQLAVRVSGCFTQVSVYQEGYGPDSRCLFCEKHLLWFAGCLGCHVCQGFFAA